MPAFHLSRSIRIDADASQVRPAVEAFSQWPRWSPWLLMEPNAKLDVYGTPGQVGHGYDWQGQVVVVGAGGIKIE